MKFYVIISAILTLTAAAVAGILPTSRGGTGANITPSNGAIITSTASVFQASTSLVMPAGGTVVIAAGATTASGSGLYIKAGSSLTTPENGAFESNGTNLYWTNSSGARFIINKTAQ